jgi:hypothetical protein
VCLLLNSISVEKETLASICDLLDFIFLILGIGLIPTDKLPGWLPSEISGENEKGGSTHSAMGLSFPLAVHSDDNKGARI